MRMKNENSKIKREPEILNEDIAIDTRVYRSVIIPLDWQIITAKIFENKTRI